MHTVCLLFGRAPGGALGGDRFVLGLLVLMVGAAAAPAWGQADFPGVPEEGHVNFRVYPTDFWGPRVGPGVGAGMVVHGLTRRHDQWLFTVAPARYEQVATLSYASANPRRARRYVLADGRALHTDRDWAGTGADGTRFVLERTAVHGRLRAGHTFLDSRALAQPVIGLSHHVIDAARGPAASPSTAGANRASALPPAGSRQTGLRLGTSLQYDTRNHALRPTSGLLLRGTASRYVSLTESALRFDRLDVGAYGYVPLGGFHRFAVRGAAALTTTRADAPIPLHLRPRLGGADVPGLRRGQLAAPNTVLASALYRFPLTGWLGLATIEGHLGVHLSGAYNDLGDEFTTTISFDEDPQADPRRPLRPTASAGLQFLVPARDHASVEFAVGIAPNRVTAVHLRFERPLRALRPPHHVLDGQW